MNFYLNGNESISSGLTKRTEGLVDAQEIEKLSKEILSENYKTSQITKQHSNSVNQNLGSDSNLSKIIAANLSGFNINLSTKAQDAIKKINTNASLHSAKNL